MSDNRILHLFDVSSEFFGKRLDVAACALLKEYSRAVVQRWIELGAIQLNAQVVACKTLLKPGDKILVDVRIEPDLAAEPQDIPLNILYEDEDCLVIDKPVGLVVHPGAGVREGTLLNALLYHAPALGALPRAGIVHRLDKDTTGLMVVAKNLPSHAALVKAMAERKIERIYQAVVQGALTAGGRVDAPIGRHPIHRLKMAVREDGGRPAVTHYRILERFARHTHVECRLETGRTHQIRVHLSHLGFPLLGDPLYGKNLQMPAGLSMEAQAVLKNFKRQALHAWRLSFAHPRDSTKALDFEAPLPADMQALLVALREGA